MAKRNSKNYVRKCKPAKARHSKGAGRGKGRFFKVKGDGWCAVKPSGKWAGCGHSQAEAKKVAGA